VPVRALVRAYRLGQQFLLEQAFVELETMDADPELRAAGFDIETVEEDGVAVCYVVGFRTTRSQHVGSTEYTVRAEPYCAPAFSVCVATACHPGIYLASKEWLSSHYEGQPVVRVRCLRSELVRAGSGDDTKYRCKRLWVVGETVGDTIAP